MNNPFQPVPPERLSLQQKQQMEAIRSAAAVLHNAVMETFPTRSRSIALTNLEQAVMWANKGVAKGE